MASLTERNWTRSLRPALMLVSVAVLLAVLRMALALAGLAALRAACWVVPVVLAEASRAVLAWVWRRSSRTVVAWLSLPRALFSAVDWRSACSEARWVP